MLPLFRKNGNSLQEIQARLEKRFEEERKEEEQERKLKLKKMLAAKNQKHDKEHFANCFPFLQDKKALKMKPFNKQAGSSDLIGGKFSPVPSRSVAGNSRPGSFNTVFGNFDLNTSKSRPGSTGSFAGNSRPGSSTLATRPGSSTLANRPGTSRFRSTKPETNAKNSPSSEDSLLKYFDFANRNTTPAKIEIQQPCPSLPAAIIRYENGDVKFDAEEIEDISSSSNESLTEQCGRDKKKEMEEDDSDNECTIYPKELLVIWSQLNNNLGTHHKRFIKEFPGCIFVRIIRAGELVEHQVELVGALALIPERVFRAKGCLTLDDNLTYEYDTKKEFFIHENDMLLIGRDDY